MKLDVIEAVERCYASPDDDQAWLGGILEALSPLDQGPGLYAQVFRWAPDGSWVAERSSVSGAFDAHALAEVARRNEVIPQGLLRRIYTPGVTYVLEKVPELREIGVDVFRKAGMADVFGALATDPDGWSMFAAIPLAASLPARRRRIPPRTAHQLRCLSAHFGSSLRLRRALRAAADAGGSEPDAVLDPGGRVLDAAGDARERGALESLVDAVRHVERARGRLRRTDPDEALQLWQGLVDGTWSLVDRCDADGKRYLLARRNEPGGEDPAALTPRERAVLAFAAIGHANKFIGYTLGLPAATVSRCLTAAQRKLKVESRAELIRHFARLVALRGGPPA